MAQLEDEATEANPTATTESIPTPSPVRSLPDLGAAASLSPAPHEALGVDASSVNASTPPQPPPLLMDILRPLLRDNAFTPRNPARFPGQPASDIRSYWPPPSVEIMLYLPKEVAAEMVKDLKEGRRFDMPSEEYGLPHFLGRLSGSCSVPYDNDEERQRFREWAVS